jgi:hypothetical protein
MLEHWNYLKSVKINPANIMRMATAQALSDKAKEFKIDLTKEKLPF